MDKYNFEDLEVLVDKISKIRKKKILEEIRDIIINNNPNIQVTSNANGLFFHFHNLTQETYVKIDDVLKNYSNNKKKLHSDNLSSDYLYSNDDFPFENNPKLKYSNKEKNIIKRKMYDNAINDNNKLDNKNDNINDSDNTESNNEINSNIFIKKRQK